MTFSGSLEPLVQKPLDGRRKVNLVSDLTAAASFPYIFSGLDVYCEENQKWYTFLGGDQTDINNWRMEGSGGGGSTDWSDITNKPTDLVQDAAYQHTDNNYTTSDKDKLASLENYDDTALTARVTANETAIADRYTKAETDGKIAEAMTDVDNEHFHPVTELPPVAQAKENHEYVVIEYEQDGTTIKSETHYLFYGGAFHLKETGGISLDGYATEQFVNNGLSGKADTSSVLALQNSLESVRTEAEGTQAELTQFKSDYVIDMAGKQTMAVINWQYEYFFAELLEMLKCGGAVIEWGDQTYMPVVGFEDKVVEDVRTINAFVHATASTEAITLLWFTWTVAEADKETVKMSPDSYYHSVGAVGVPWVAAQLSYKQDTLVSGQNIKTVNGNDITGEGNVQIRVGVGDEYDINNMPSYNEIAADIANHQLRYIGGNWQVRGISWDDESNVVSLWAAYDRQIKTYDFEPTGKDDPLPEPYNIYDGYTNAAMMGVISSPYRGVSFTYNNNGFARYELNDDSIKFLQREPNKQTVFEKTYTIGANFEVGVEKWYGTYTENGVTYQVYSKMLYIPALPATAGVEGYPHGITGIKQILQVYGFTTDGFVLNTPRQNIQDNIGIYQVQKAGNIQIEVGKDRSSKAAYVCLVYAKNN